MLTPKNIALGGGGASYITDYNANFYNPANLMIQDREAKTSFGLFTPGFYFNGVQNFQNLNSQRENFLNYIQPDPVNQPQLNASTRQTLLDENYGRNRTTSLHRARADITWFGINWKKNEKAFSVVARSRRASSFEVGKAWYSDVPVIEDNVEILDRSLKHSFLTLHEISFGYAESVPFLNGLSSRLDNFVIGIAPKFLLSGSLQNASWNNVYARNLDGNNFQRKQTFSYAAVGKFNDAITSFEANNFALLQNSNSFNNSYTDITGFGAGLDIGLTYLLTLGDDFSIVNTEDEFTRKSLRLSFSITDVGFINYAKNARQISDQSSTSTIADPNLGLSNTTFIGSSGQFIQYISDYAESNPFEGNPQSEESFSNLLPTSLNAGALFQLNRLKLMGDLRVGFTNNAFNSTKLISSFGIEIRPFQFLPLRAGTQLATELPGIFSLGTGIETKHWDLSIATQFTSRFDTNTSLAAVSMAALQFHF